MKRGSGILFLGVVLSVLFLVGVVSAYQCSDCKDFKILDSATDAKGVKKNFGVPCDGKIRAYANNDNFYVGVKIPNQARKQTLYICDGGPNDEGVRRCDPSKDNNICCGGIKTYVPNGGGLICDREGTKVYSGNKGGPNRCSGNAFKENWVDVKQGDILEMIPGSAGTNVGTFWVEFKATGTCEGVPTTEGNGVPQCSDGIDNDGDGKIDALVEIDTAGSFSISGDTRIRDELNKIGDTTHPELIKESGSIQSVSPKRVYMACQKKWEVGCVVPDADRNDYGKIERKDGFSGKLYCNKVTADKFCELKSYSSARYTCKKSYKSPSDNTNVYWSPEDNEFKVVRADDSRYIDPTNKVIGTITCTNPMSACNDGIDDDGDGDADYPDDDGCASENDNSEVPHDPQCDNPDDDTEGDPVTQCNDGIDNDGDGLNDENDSDCWTNPTDLDTYDPSDPLEETTQCNDGYDNDKDGEIDLADSDCTDGNDPLEGPTQCNDEYDNDGDGNIDSDDSDCWTDPTNEDTYDPNDPIEGTVIQCSDTIDNDDDSFCDIVGGTCTSPVTPGDSDCLGPDGTTYDPNDPLEGPTQCNDGLDNDGDGDIDLDDSDCDDSNDPTEGVYVPGVLGITDAHWENMNGVPITTSDLNDNVKLVVSGVEFVGKTINFEIREKESLLGIDWLWPDSIIADLSDIGFTTWRAGQNSELTSGEYYFIATIEGVEKISNNLVVSNSKDNSNPEIEILSPKDKQIYFKDEELLFRAKVSDDDDLDLNWEWDLGEGNEIRTGAIRSGEFIEFNYAYPTGGQKNMVLNVDDGRDGIGRSQISIIAIASKYILAYIDSPLRGEVINQGDVVLDASSVYSVEETRDGNNIRTITCLKGICPAYTEGCPPELAGMQAGKDSCPSDNDNKCCLNVLNDPLETGRAPDYSDIEFKWNFYQDDGGEYVLVANKIVLDNPITNYLFLRADFYKTILTTSINPSSSASTNFYLDFEIPTPTCKLIESENDLTSAKPKEVFVGESYWEINSVLKRTDDGSEANCYQADGVQSDGVDNENFDNTCCPGLSICNPESGVCEFNAQPELGCAQFTEDNCDGNTNIAKNDLITTIGDDCLKTEEIQQLGSSCIKYKRCYCEWVETEDSSGTCGATFEEVYTASCKGTTPKGKCTITHIDSEGSCDTEGYIIAKWIGIWKVDGVVAPNTGQCPAEGTTTFDCKDVAKLGFFSMFNFIIAILSIITIYGIMLRKED